MTIADAPSAPPIQAHGIRFGWDADGTTCIVQGGTLSDAEKRVLNNEADDVAVLGLDGAITFVFPQKRGISDVYVAVNTTDTGAKPTQFNVEFSLNTTDGTDGTWVDLETGQASNAGWSVKSTYRKVGTSADDIGIFSPSYVGTDLQGIRLTFGPAAYSTQAPVDLRAIHLYGSLDSSNPGWSQYSFSLASILSTVYPGISVRGSARLLSAAGLVNTTGVPLDITYTIEALTDNSVHPWVNTLLMDTSNGHYSQWDSSLSVSVTGASAPGWNVGVAVSTPPDQDNELGCVRVRAHAPGFNDEFTYVFFDGSADWADPNDISQPLGSSVLNTYVIWDVVPRHDIVAGLTEVKVLASLPPAPFASTAPWTASVIGVPFMYDNNEQLISTIAATTSTDVPIDSWAYVSTSDPYPEGRHAGLGRGCSFPHAEFTFRVPLDSVNLAGTSSALARLSVGTVSNSVAEFITILPFPPQPPPPIPQLQGATPIRLPKGGKYRYLFHDLLTNEPLAELELKNVSYDFALNAPGNFSGSLNISSQQAAMENVIGSTVPGRTAVYIDRGGIITWGGILWKRRYSASSRTAILEGKTFESYFNRRRITDSLSFPNTDQLVVMQTLINNLQSKPNGNIGIEVGTETSGIAIDAFFFWFELKPYLEVLQEFAGVQHGFDFRVRCFRDSETKLIRKVLEFGYPHIGRTVLNTNLLFEYPNGNVVTYEWDEDAESGVDSFFATGANEGEALMVSTSTSQPLLDQGWPLLQDSAAYADVTLWPDLDIRSQADLQARLAPIVTPALTVYGDADPVLGSYSVGDFARFRIRDDRFPSGVDIAQRLYGIKVSVDAGGTREKVDLTIGVQQQ